MKNFKKFKVLKKYFMEENQALVFEEKVASFFKKRGYRKVKIREKVIGESGVKHEIDVVVYDNLDERKILYGCQCKYWNKKVGVKEIKEWIETCRDIKATPVVVSLLGFSRDAKKYADAHKVYLITNKELEIEAPQITSNEYEAWKKELESIDNDIERILFCLASIYKTEILQEAIKADNTPPEELRFENPKLYELFINPDNQLLTKFLLSINKSEEGEYAFGPVVSFEPFPHAFPLPSEIWKVKDFIEDILEKMNRKPVEGFNTDYGTKCKIFLKSWLALAQVNILKEISSRMWYNSDYICGKYREGTLAYDRKREIIVGEPGERWSKYLNDTKEFWKKFLSRHKELNITQLSKLLNTDLKCLNEKDKYPNPIMQLFRRSQVITKAYEKNKEKIEIIITELSH